MDVALTGAVQPEGANLFLRRKGTDLFKESE